MIGKDIWRVWRPKQERIQMKKSQKNKKKKWIPITVVAVVAVVLAVFFIMPMVTMRNMQAAGTATQVATAQAGAIEVSVVGSGTIETGGTSYIKIPSALTPETILVEAGDTVQKGDTLATLDSVKLQSAISDVQSEIASIDADIESSQGDTDAQEIASPVEGRVKRIFAGAGQEISQVVAENGSLLVLSVDGKMKVAFSSASPLAVGDEVTVVLEDGSEKDGTVSLISGEEATVTLTDNGPVYGEQVDILSESGEALGSGTLEINSPLEVLGGNGTVKRVDVEENEAVGSGDTLLTLEETVASQEYSTLIAQREQYAALLRLMLTYSQTNSIVAEQDGTISEVLVAAEEEGQAAADSSASNGNNQNVIAQADAQSSVGRDADSGVALYAQPDFGSALVALSDTSAQPEASQSSVTPLNGTIEVAMTAPAAGAVPESTLTVPAGGGYTGTVTWEPATTQFAEQTGYTATVILTADSGYVFDQGTTVNVTGATVDMQSILISTETEQNTLTFRVSFPETTAGAQASPNPDSGLEASGASGAQTGGVSGSAGSSYSAGGLSGLSGSSGASTGTETSADVDTGSSTNASLMQNAFSLVSGDNVEVTVNIDELDILTLEVGQSAVITLDALPDDTFTGTVTKISDVGSSQSGVTTYPVTISIDVPEDTAVKAGMNASATIVTASSDNVLLIPMNALQEEGEETFVYVVSAAASADEAQGGAMGERRTVETGLSDGVNVEIISGLQEGEMVAYTEASTDEDGVFMMGGMAMGGGSAPDGASFSMEGGPQGGGGAAPPGGGPQ